MSIKFRKNSLAIPQGSIFPESQAKNMKKLKLKTGDFSVVTITALGSKNVGLAEIANGYTVIVPKAKLGETLKVQIEKISMKPKYVTAKIVEVVKETTKTVPVKVEDILEIIVQKQGPQGSGLNLLTNNFTIIIQPVGKSGQIKIGDKMQVKITRVKEKYAFAKPLELNSKTERSINRVKVTSELRRASDLLNSVNVGSQFTLTLPLTSKTLNNYVVIQLKNSLVFIKMSLGVQLGERIRIQIVKTTSRLVYKGVYGAFVLKL